LFAPFNKFFAKASNAYTWGVKRIIRGGMMAFSQLDLTSGSITMTGLDLLRKIGYKR